MRKKELWIISALFLMDVFNNVIASEWAITSKAQIGNMKYEINDGADIRNDENMLLGGVELTIRRSKFFIGGKFDKTFGGDTTLLNEMSNLERRELSLQAGWAIADNVAIFIGHFIGNTEIFATSNADQSLDFKENGLFLGGVYRYLTGPTSQISFNAAIARLDGELDLTLLGNQFSWDGDTMGLSAGISWSKKLSEHVNFALRLDYRKYSFSNMKLTSSTTTIDSINDLGKFDETTLAYKAILSYSL